jgi:predicted kinase
VVLVSGVPGTGKSAVARPLAAELGFALLGKDRIKETLYDTLCGGPDPADRELSQRLGAAAMEVLWALAADATDVVLDVNFWVDDERQLAWIRALSGCPVEVHCVCPLDLAARRYQTRAATRHPVHGPPDDVLRPETMARSSRPLGLGPVITTDTSGSVDIPVLAAEVLCCFATAAG